MKLLLLDFGRIVGDHFVMKKGEDYKDMKNKCVINMTEYVLCMTHKVYTRLIDEASLR